MKKFIYLVVGFVLGLLTVTAVAVTYICEVVEYPVFINGVEYSTDELPLLNYDGNTYAPMRAFLESAGMTVVWDDETSSIVIMDSPEPQQVKPSVPTIMMTPDGIDARLDSENGRYIVFLSSWRGIYSNSIYKITYSDISTKTFGLYKGDTLLLDAIIMPDDLIGFEYDYYCNTILPAIMG